MNSTSGTSTMATAFGGQKRTADRHPATPASASARQGSEQPPTHDVFDVVERAGRKPQWNKVGAVYANGGSETVVLFELDGATRELDLVAIDRVRRPIRPFGDPTKFPTHDLVVGEGKGLSRVGVAFANKDGSLSLVIDEGRRDGPTKRLQMRLCRPQRL